jgi:hypothetical protein
VIGLAILVSSCSGWTEAANDWAVTSIDGSTLSIVVAVGSGSCDRFQRVVVEETPEDVTITAVVETRSANLLGQGCDMDMNFEYVDLTLEEPLGERSLVGCGRRGADGLGDYFSGRDGGRQGRDCAEVVDGW